MLGKKKVVRIIAAVIAGVFCFTSAAPAQPAIPLNVEPSIGNQFLKPSDLKLPETLATIQNSHQQEGNSPFVVIIQDAHAVRDAQEHIWKLVALLQDKYQIDLVALEGGSGALDPSLFRAFPDEFTKAQVMINYMNRGELTGAEMASILNPKPGVYYGIEDWGLYEANYVAYLASSQARSKARNALDNIRAGLDKERKKIYSEPLNQFHEELKKFETENTYLLEFLKYLSSVPGAEPRIKQYPHIEKLYQSYQFDEASSGSKPGIESSVRQMANAFKTKYVARMNFKQQMEFHKNYQSFVTGQVESAEFLKVLVDIGAEIGVRARLTPEMLALIGQNDTLASIKGTLLFQEFEKLVAEIEDGLAQKAEERTLAKQYRKLKLIGDLASLELTREQLDEFTDHQQDYEKFFQDRGTGALELLQPSIRFYEYARKRDDAFLRNLTRLLKEQKRSNAIVLAGGFHSQGFELNLKNENISYVVVTPRIQKLDGEEYYDEVMQGKMSYKPYLRTTFYDAFARHASQQFVSKLNEPDFRKNIKLWRDQIIRQLSSEGRVDQSGKYTRYIDELLTSYYEKFGKSEKPGEVRSALLKTAKKEIDDYHKAKLSQIWNVFQRQLKDFTAGLDSLRRNQKETPQSVDALLQQVGANARAGLQLPVIANLSPELRFGILDRYFKTGEVPALADLQPGALQVPFATPEAITEALVDSVRNAPAPSEQVVDMLSKTEAIQNAAQQIAGMGEIVRQASPEIKPPAAVNPANLQNLVGSVTQNAQQELLNAAAVTPAAVSLAIARAITNNQAPQQAASNIVIQSQPTETVRIGNVLVTQGKLESLNPTVLPNVARPTVTAALPEAAPEQIVIGINPRAIAGNAAYQTAFRDLLQGIVEAEPAVTDQGYERARSELRSNLAKPLEAIEYSPSADGHAFRLRFQDGTSVDLPISESQGAMSQVYIGDAGDGTVYVLKFDASAFNDNPDDKLLMERMFWTGVRVAEVAKQRIPDYPLEVVSSGKYEVEGPFKGMNYAVFHNPKGKALADVIRDRAIFRTDLTLQQRIEVSLKGLENYRDLLDKAGIAYMDIHPKNLLDTGLPIDPGGLFLNSEDDGIFQTENPESLFYGFDPGAMAIQNRGTSPYFDPSILREFIPGSYSYTSVKVRLKIQSEEQELDREVSLDREAWLRYVVLHQFIRAAGSLLGLNSVLERTGYLGNFSPDAVRSFLRGITNNLPQNFRDQAVRDIENILNLIDGKAVYRELSELYQGYIQTAGELDQIPQSEVDPIAQWNQGWQELQRNWIKNKFETLQTNLESFQSIVENPQFANTLESEDLLTRRAVETEQNAFLTPVEEDVINLGPSGTNNLFLGEDKKITDTFSGERSINLDLIRQEASGGYDGSQAEGLPFRVTGDGTVVRAPNQPVVTGGGTVIRTPLQPVKTEGGTVIRTPPTLAEVAVQRVTDELGNDIEISEQQGTVSLKPAGSPGQAVPELRLNMSETGMTAVVIEPDEDPVVLGQEVQGASSLVNLGTNDAGEIYALYRPIPIGAESDTRANSLLLMRYLWIADTIQPRGDFNIPKPVLAYWFQQNPTSQRELTQNLLVLAQNKAGRTMDSLFENVGTPKDNLPVWIGLQSHFDYLKEIYKLKYLGGFNLHDIKPQNALTNVTQNAEGEYEYQGITVLDLAGGAWDNPEDEPPSTHPMFSFFSNPEQAETYYAKWSDRGLKSAVTSVETTFDVQTQTLNEMKPYMAIQVLEGYKTFFEISSTFWPVATGDFSREKDTAPRDMFKGVYNGNKQSEFVQHLREISVLPPGLTDLELEEVNNLLDQIRQNRQFDLFMQYRVTSPEKISKFFEVNQYTGASDPRWIKVQNDWLAGKFLKLIALESRLRELMANITGSPELKELIKKDKVDLGPRLRGKRLAAIAGAVRNQGADIKIRSLMESYPEEAAYVIIKSNPQDSNHAIYNQIISFLGIQAGKVSADDPSQSQILKLFAQQDGEISKDFRGGVFETSADTQRIVEELSSNFDARLRPPTLQNPEVSPLAPEETAEEARENNNIQRSEIRAAQTVQDPWTSKSIETVTVQESLAWLEQINREIEELDGSKLFPSIRPPKTDPGSLARRAALEQARAQIENHLDLPDMMRFPAGKPVYEHSATVISDADQQPYTYSLLARYNPSKGTIDFDLVNDRDSNFLQTVYYPAEKTLYIAYVRMPEGKGLYSKMMDELLKGLSEKGVQVDSIIQESSTRSAIQGNEVRSRSGRVMAEKEDFRYAYGNMPDARLAQTVMGRAVQGSFIHMVEVQRGDEYRMRSLPLTDEIFSLIEKAREMTAQVNWYQKVSASDVNALAEQHYAAAEQVAATEPWLAELLELNGKYLQYKIRISPSRSERFYTAVNRLAAPVVTATPAVESANVPTLRLGIGSESPEQKARIFYQNVIADNPTLNSIIKSVTMETSFDSEPGYDGLYRLRGSFNDGNGNPIMIKNPNNPEERARPFWFDIAANATPGSQDVVEVLQVSRYFDRNVSTELMRAMLNFLQQKNFKKVVFIFKDPNNETEKENTTKFFNAIFGQWASSGSFSADISKDKYVLNLDSLDLLRPRTLAEVGDQFLTNQTGRKAAVGVRSELRQVSLTQAETNPLVALTGVSGADVAGVSTQNLESVLTDIAQNVSLNIRSQTRRETVDFLRSFRGKSDGETVAAFGSTLSSLIAQYFPGSGEGLLGRVMAGIANALARLTGFALPTSEIEAALPAEFSPMTDQAKFMLNDRALLNIALNNLETPVQLSNADVKVFDGTLVAPSENVLEHEKDKEFVRSELRTAGVAVSYPLEIESQVRDIISLPGVIPLAIRNQSGIETKKMGSFDRALMVLNEGTGIKTDVRTRNQIEGVYFNSGAAYLRESGLYLHQLGTLAEMALSNQSVKQLMKADGGLYTMTPNAFSALVDFVNKLALDKEVQTAYAKSA